MGVLVPTPEEINKNQEDSISVTTRIPFQVLEIFGIMTPTTRSIPVDYACYSGKKIGMTSTRTTVRALRLLFNQLCPSVPTQCSRLLISWSNDFDLNEFHFQIETFIFKLKQSPPGGQISLELSNIVHFPDFLEWPISNAHSNLKKGKAPSRNFTNSRGMVTHSRTGSNIRIFCVRLSTENTPLREPSSGRFQFLQFSVLDCVGPSRVIFQLQTITCRSCI